MKRLSLASYAPLLGVLVLGLALRLLLWNNLPRPGLISDEGEYLAAATWLAQGRNFSWYLGYLWTRAPVYALFVAAHLFLFDDLRAVYVTQIAFSLLNVVLVYALCQSITQLTTHRFRTASIAALLMALYLPFATFTQVLLSETLYLTLLLGGFLALVRASALSPQPSAFSPQPSALSPRVGWVALAGVLFGLATLTRSLTLAFLPLAALWVAGIGHSAPRDWWRLTRRGVLSGAVFLACAGALILPWTVYNSVRLYDGLVVVDTSGAFNLLLGARTAYDSGRNDAATRDFVLILLGQKEASKLTTPACATLPAPLPSSQAARQSAMTREGLCLIGAKPLAFIQKSLGELVDLFQINY
ncbi:MAG: hypothetical protein H7Z42_20160, partial [Roseiflexaceae bacterium]|nr:hypothetical protein [Roseiflexaceae bacterium]